MRNNWLDIIQHCLLPPTCILCDHIGHETLDLCRYCRADLPRNTRCCPLCALPYHAVGATICGQCQIRPRHFDSTYAPFLYRDAVAYLITRLKFNAQYKNARLLGQLLSIELAARAQYPEALIPVPLHPRRYRERGFNQTLEIAKIVAGELGLELRLDLCRRRRDTPHQTGLSGRRRRANLTNAFSITRAPPTHVAILDDVMTTGSTADALAAALKKAGAERVDVWVCARTT